MENISVSFNVLPTNRKIFCFLLLCFGIGMKSYIGTISSAFKSKLSGNNTAVVHRTKTISRVNTQHTEHTTRHTSGMIHLTLHTRWSVESIECCTLYCWPDIFSFIFPFRQTHTKYKNKRLFSAR